jgi:N-methylhydantoinase A
MVDGISIVSVQRGEDPRKYTLVVAGGAGAVHAASLANLIGIRRLLVPKTSSVFCALGGVIADVRHDFVKSVTSRTADLSLAALKAEFDEMKKIGNEYLEREGVSVKDRYGRRTVDMRYKGQYHELEVPLPVPPSASAAESEEEVMGQLVEDFHAMHESLYSYRDAAETEILNLRMAACGVVHTPDLKEKSFVSRDANPFLKGRRDVYFEGNGGYIGTPVFDGDRMEVGNVVKGPAVVELKTTTIVVPPSANLELTPYESFLIEFAE